MHTHTHTHKHTHTHTMSKWRMLQFASSRCCMIRTHTHTHTHTHTDYCARHLPKERDEGIDGKRGAFSHNVLEEPVEQVRAVFDRRVQISADAAESIENLVEVRQQARARHLGHVVQRLRSCRTTSREATLSRLVQHRAGGADRRCARQGHARRETGGCTRGEEGTRASHA